MIITYERDVKGYQYLEDLSNLQDDLFEINTSKLNYQVKIKDWKFSNFKNEMDIRGVRFYHSGFKDVHFTKIKKRFHYYPMENCFFKKCTLENCVFYSISKCKFDSCTFINCVVGDVQQTLIRKNCTLKDTFLVRAPHYLSFFLGKRYSNNSFSIHEDFKNKNNKTEHEIYKSIYGDIGEKFVVGDEIFFDVKGFKNNLDIEIDKDKLYLGTIKKKTHYVRDDLKIQLEIQNDIFHMISISSDFCFTKKEILNKKLNKILCEV